MPVAGAVKLDIIADSQDRASAVLRQVQGELKRTEDRIRATSAAAREDVDISEILARGSGKARQELKAEVDMREAAAQKRRELVRAAREGVDATNAEGNALGGLKNKIEAASRAKELLNKVLGLTGFVTIAAAAVEGIVSLIDSLDEYKVTLGEVEGNQTRFNELVGKLSDFARDADLKLMTEGQKELAKAIEESSKAVDDYLELQKKTETAEGALAQAVKRRSEYQQGLNAQGFATLLQRREQRDLDEQVRKLERDVAASKEAQQKSAEAVQAAVAGATPAYQEHLRIVREMVGLQDKIAVRRPSEMEAAVSAIDLAKKAAAEADKKADKDEEAGRKAGSRFAERERELEREVALLRAGSEVEADRLRAAWLQDDAVARRVSRREVELTIQKQQLEHDREMAKFNADVAASNDAARKANSERADRKSALLDELSLARARTDEQRTEIALSNRLAQIERDRRAGRIDSEEASTSAAIARAEAEEKSLEERAKGIERVGRAAQIAAPAIGQLSGRLSGLAGAVDEVAKTWATFERGQVSLGDAVSGTLGILGHAIAQSIADKRTQAGVEGGFEAAASIASFAAGNVPAGIGHAAAAAAFFAVAAGAGGASQGGGASAGGASASGGGSNATPITDAPIRRQSSWQDDRRELIIVQAREGIVYGLSSDVARVASGTARSLRGSGMERRGF